MEETEEQKIARWSAMTTAELVAEAEVLIGEMGKDPTIIHIRASLAAMELPVLMGVLATGMRACQTDHSEQAQLLLALVTIEFASRTVDA